MKPPKVGEKVLALNFNDLDLVTEVNDEFITTQSNGLSYQWTSYGFWKYHTLPLDYNFKTQLKELLNGEYK